MKRFAILACLSALTVAGCGSSGTTPSSPPQVFAIQMRASNETPPITGAEANASGTATLTFNVTGSAGSFSSGTVDFNVSLSGFPNGTLLTAAHIHPGAAGVPGGVLLGTGLSTSDNVVLTNGSATFSKNGVAISADQANQILAAPQNFYFNVHTTTSPGGAVRGQLK
jgi:hypothetical protein